MPRTATKKKSAKTSTAKSKAPAKRKASAKPATTRAKAASSRSTHKPTAKKPKAVAKAKTSAKTAAPKKAARKTKISKNKLVSQDTFTPEQKARLINLIQIVVATRKRKQGGARSLARIDQVLAKHNQRFPDPEHKFDATIQIGMQFGSPQNHPSVYAPTASRQSDEVALYNILQEMSKGKLGFDEAESKLSNIPTSNGEKKS